jgi:hypothetical protein
MTNLATFLCFFIPQDSNWHDTLFLHFSYSFALEILCSKGGLTHLSRYAPDEVNTDAKRQERFLDGLIGTLNYHLQSHTFPNFQMLLNKAIGLENKYKKLHEQKCKFQSWGQSSSNTRPRYNLSHDSEFSSTGQGRNYGQNQ